MDIKKVIKEAGVKHWQLADAIGISEATMVRWLRKPQDKESIILAALDRMKRGEVSETHHDG